MVYRVNRKGARTVRCGAPVLQVIVSDVVPSPHILWPVSEVIQDLGCEVLVHPCEPKLVPQE